jgi:cell division septation protein DedD
MDQQLKARLIGASVLVLIAVLLIPELLSGRKADTSSAPAADSARGTRTYTIDLGGATATRPGPSVPAPVVPAPPVDTGRANTAPRPTAPTTAREQGARATAGDAAASIDTPAAASDDAASIDVPAAARPDGAGPNTRAPTVTATVAPAVATPAAPEQPASATRRGWSVQVGAFSSSATANKLVGDLRQDGFDAYVAPLQRSGKTLHRVRVGPEDSRAAAERLAGRLQGRKLPVTVVAND